MNFQHHRVKGKMNSFEVILYYRLGSAHNNVLQGRGVEMALKVKFKKNRADSRDRDVLV